VIQTFTRTLAVLEYGVASVTPPHRDESCDRHLVKTLPAGALLVVADGARHGPGHKLGAAAAARMAIRTVADHAREDPAMLIQRCHEQLKTTAGVVMSLAVVNAAEHTLTWLGVGNVACTLWRFEPHMGEVSEEMPGRPGVVGFRLPVLQPRVVPIAPGDMIVLATGGIRPDFEYWFTADQSPRVIAEHISSTYYKGMDDGLVMVARFQGSGE
jgi:phosphoserine phosphatase RsbX